MANAPRGLFSSSIHEEYDGVSHSFDVGVQIEKWVAVLASSRVILIFANYRSRYCQRRGFGTHP